MTRLPPVVRTVRLRCSRHQAFARFTQDISAWWPPGFTVSGQRPARVTVEGKVGGRVFEADHDGKEHDWGVVIAWVPGRRVTFSWALGVSGGTTDVDLLFTDRGQGCELTLEHRAWAEDQQADRAKFDAPDGWDRVLEAYRTYAESHSRPGET